MTTPMAQDVQGIQRLLTQLQNDREAREELSRNGIDLSQFSRQLGRAPGPQSQITPVTALAVAAPEVVVSAGFIVAAFILLLATAYVLTHMRSFQQVIMAVIETAREMTKVQARARSLPKQKYFDPKCKPLYDSFMQVMGKMIQRANSPAAKSGHGLTGEFIKGIRELGDEFLTVLRDLMQCLGVKRGSPEWEFLVGESGVIKLAIGYAKKVLTLRP